MVNRSDLCKAFLVSAGWGMAKRTALAGDASSRRYERLTRDYKTALLMDAPQDVETVVCPPNASPEERKALGYNACARLAGSNMRSFSTIAKTLTDHGLSAPIIYALDEENGFAIIEDLGNEIYASAIIQGLGEQQLYESAIDVLVELANKEIKPDKNKPLMSYDMTAYMAEVDLLTQWYWPHKKTVKISANEQADYSAIWEKVLSHLEPPTMMVLRDYHAENLLWLPHREGIKRTGVIDFQDSLIGSKAYDAVSLLEDARRDVSPELAPLMKKRLCNGLSLNKEASEQFEMEYAILGAQRNAKILGIFARLAHRDGKMHYLDLLPRVGAHFKRNLHHDALSDLKSFVYDTNIMELD